MKTLLLALCCLFASTSIVQADPLLDAMIAAPRFDVRAEPRKRGGKILTIMGITHLVLGGALLAEMAITTGQCKATPGCRNELGGVPEIVAGSLLVSSGTVFVATGIPLWVSGARRASMEAGGLRVAF